MLCQPMSLFLGAGAKRECSELFSLCSLSPTKLAYGGVKDDRRHRCL